MNKANGVPARAKQAETIATERVCVGRAIWMERMLAALGNGVKGSGWSYIGQMQNSLSWCFSLKTNPDGWRANPDEETTNWRAVCGKTARTVRREGRA